MKDNADFQYMKLNTKHIFVDTSYQRNIDAARVRRIVKEFDKNLVNVCKVSFRDGRYWVFDGQHTIAALKARNGGKDVVVDCKVYQGLTKLDEKNLFVQQNGLARPVQTNQKYKANYNYGDPEVKELVRCIELAGFWVDFGRAQAQWKILALSSAHKAHKMLGSSDFVDMLGIIGSAWNGDKTSACAEILEGLAIFYDTYRGEFDKNYLVKKLSSVAPTEIVREGNVSRSSGKKKFARVILGIYNNKKQTKLGDRL